MKTSAMFTSEKKNATNILTSKSSSKSIECSSTLKEDSIITFQGLKVSDRALLIVQIKTYKINNHFHLSHLQFKL